MAYAPNQPKDCHTMRSSEDAAIGKTEVHQIRKTEHWRERWINHRTNPVVSSEQPECYPSHWIDPVVSTGLSCGVQRATRVQSWSPDRSGGQHRTMQCRANPSHQMFWWPKGPSHRSNPIVNRGKMSTELHNGLVRWCQWAHTGSIQWYWASFQ